jgi:multidrug efflux system membrane fusion protein
VDPGNYVQAGSSTGIAVIAQMQPISVIFTVAEDALGKILPQIRAGAKLVAVAYDRGNVKKLATGTVDALDSQIDTTTGMVKLRAVFDNADESLFPNQFVNIVLEASTIHDAVAAPIAGVQHGAPGDYAYVIKDGKASVRVVKLGQADGDYVQILSGLAPGDVIVVDGADRLRDGAEARIVSDGPKGGKAKSSQTNDGKANNGKDGDVAHE